MVWLWPLRWDSGETLSGWVAPIAAGPPVTSKSSFEPPELCIAAEHKVLEGYRLCLPKFCRAQAPPPPVRASIRLHWEHVVYFIFFDGEEKKDCSREDSSHWHAMATSSEQLLQNYTTSSESQQERVDAMGRCWWKWWRVKSGKCSVLRQSLNTKKIPSAWWSTSRKDPQL